jgi:hypothetical protein
MIPGSGFAIADEKGHRKQRGASSHDHDHKNDSATHVLGAGERANLPGVGECDRNRNEGQAGEGKGIVSGK